MKRRLNILSILVFIVLGLSLYTTGYQFGTGMKAGMSLAKEQHRNRKHVTDLCLQAISVLWMSYLRSP
jgi:hypothetical protein